VFGANLMSVIVFLPRRQQRTDYPMIYYDLVLLIIPIVLIGTSIGVILNVIFPPWLIVAILFITLFVTSIDIIREAFKLLHNSEELMYEDLESSENPEVVPFVDRINNAQNELELQKIYWWDGLQYPIHKYLVLACAWILLCATSLLRGSKKVPPLLPGIVPCGLWWYLIWVIFMVIMLWLSLLYGGILYRKHLFKQYYGYNYEPGEIRFSKFRAFVVPLLFVIVGIVSSLVGMGGGIVLSPMLLELGVMPPASVATTAFIGVSDCITKRCLSISAVYLLIWCGAIFWIWCHLLEY